MEFPYLGYVVFIFVIAIDLTFVCSSRCPRLTLPNGRVRNRARGRTAQFRCNRGYTRVGPKMAICLKSNQWSQKPPVCVGTGCPKIDLPPNLNATKLYRGGVLHFTCASGYTRQGPEKISCIGQDWNAAPPICIKGRSLGCDFETEGLCGWSQAVEADKMDWIRHKGATATKDTGPQVDHTLKTPEGHYLFIETSAPSKKGYSAKLISPKYSPQDVLGVCLEFFYHMFGSDRSGGVGSLEVFLKPNDVPLNQLTTHDKVMSLFEMDGNQGDEWHRQEIELPLMENSFQFVFEAHKENSWLSDIALDDIRLYNCTNSTTTIITSPTERTDTIPTTTTTPAATKKQTTTSMPVTDRWRTTTTTTTPRPTTARRRTTTRTPRPTTARRRTTTTTPRPTTARRRTTTTTPRPTTARRRTTTTTPRLTTARRRTTTRTPRPTTSRRTTTTTSKPTTVWMRRQSLEHSRISTTTSAKSPLSSPKFHPVHKVTPQQPTSLPRTPDLSKKTSTNYGKDQKTETTFFDNKIKSTIETNIDNSTSNGNVGVGKSQDRPNSSVSSSQKLIPLIAGVAAAVVLVAVVIAILAFKWSKKQRMKEEKEMDDQMNIITDYVETSLSRD